jgi:tetratricopeptide (TPR) repeat protein
MGKSRGSGQPPSTPPNGHRNGQQNGQSPGSPKPGGRPPGGGGASSAGSAAGGSSVEKFYAELDRCWGLLERGDLDGAQSLALTLLRTDGDAPELYVLLGMIEGMQGEPEKALTYYERAMDIDPEYVEPIICAAELQIWELEDFDKALTLCERALDLAEEEDEYVDALLLKAEALSNLSREQEAYATLQELPAIALGEPSYHLRAARLLHDLGYNADARDHFQRALQLDPDNSDALHGIGMCASEDGDRSTMIECFQKVRLADLSEEPPPWGVPAARFSQLCSAAIDELPDQLRKLIANVPVIATDYPSAELVKDGVDPRVLGLFTGVPHGEKSNIGGTPHLDAIFLFQRNIERMAYSTEDVENEIHITLVHEAGHFFSLSDEQLEAMGLG